MEILYLASKSKLKCDAVQEVIDEYDISIDIQTHSPKGTPEQPVNFTYECCKKRIEITQKDFGVDLDQEDDGYFPYENTAVLSIENGIREYNGNLYDICVVVLKTHEKEYFAESDMKLKFNDELTLYYKLAKMETPDDYKHKDYGLSVTVGEIIHRNKGYPKDDWHHYFPAASSSEKLFHSALVQNEKYYSEGGFDRSSQIQNALRKCFIEYQKDQIKKQITLHKDFPKKGVIFQDLSHVISNNILLNYLVNCMKEIILTRLAGVKITKVVGLDSRGFIYGPLLAYDIDAGFVMIRKPGKLPGKTISTDYKTEYSTDTFQMLDNVISKDDNVLIVDDLVATGGSLLAAKELVEKSGGNVIGCFTVLKVDNLFEIASSKIDNLLTLF